ncbi:MAG: acyltransferase, partial [bacterium]|nr:acyltransferase [bacterium]
SMPFCFYVLWYYRAYFCMFFFIPLMNKGMELMNKNEGRMLVASIFILLTIIPTCLNDDVYITNAGYSCFWLMGCYMVGAYFSKYEIEKKIKWWALLIILIVSISLTFGCFKIPYDVFFLSYLVDYTSPTIFINGAMLVLLFAKMKPHKVTKYIIKFFAPLAFSVYVIHVSPYFWQKFMYNRFTNLVNLNPFLFPLAVLGIAILLFICFALIDYIRYLLFKVCRVKEFFNYLELKIRKLLSKVFKDDNKVENKETVLEANEENNIEIEVEK